MTVATKDRDLEFLMGLDKKLRTYQKSTFTANMSGTTFPVGTWQYHDLHLTPEQLKRIFSICREKDLPMQVVNTAMGFQVGYEVHVPEFEVPGVIPTTEVAVCFTERQLPDPKKYGHVWRFVTRARNRELVRRYFKTEIKEHSVYEY